MKTKPQEPIDDGGVHAVETVRRALDASVVGLDAATVSRLAHARRAAVATAGRPVAPGWLPRWQPLLGAAATLALGFALWTQLAMPPGVPPLPLYDDPIETAVAAELELFEDLEFVAWMVAEADREAAGDAAQSG
jgi:hypothetical protein